MNHITTARFSTGRTTTTPHLWQYDYGQLLKIEGLELPVAYEVHFANQDIHGETKTVIGNADGVMIPDEFMATGKTVYAWIFLHDDVTDGETEYKITIPVRMRPQPTNDEPTPVQQDVITQAIAALNSAVEQTATTKAGEASASATAASQSATAAAGSASDASDAADRAETAAGSVSAAAEQIATNTADIADLKDDLSSISQTTKNLINISLLDETANKGLTYSCGSNNHIVITGTTTATNADSKFALAAPMELKSGKNYVLAFTDGFTTGSESATVFLMGNGASVYNGAVSKNTTFKAFTVSNDVTVDAIWLRISASGESAHINTRVQIEEGSVPSSYIAPVTANDAVLEARLDALENKLVDVVFSNGYFKNNYPAYDNNSSCCSWIITDDIIKVKAGSAITKTGSTMYFIIKKYNADGEYVSDLLSANLSGRYVFDEDANIRIAVRATDYAYLIPSNASDNYSFAIYGDDERKKEIKVYFIGVGSGQDILSGQSQLIRFPNGKNLLIDSHLVTYYAGFHDRLRECGVRRIDYYVQSHYHRDHCGLLGIYNNNPRWIDIEGATVYLPQLITAESISQISDASDLLQRQTDMIDMFDACNCTIIRPTDEQVVKLWDKASLQFYNADHSVYSDSQGDYYSQNYNDWSLCCYLLYGLNAINFSADIGPIGQRKVGGTLDKATILTAPHHGWDNGANNLIPQFINNVNPDVVISVNGWEHNPDNANSAANIMLATSAMQSFCEANAVSNYCTFDNGMIGILLKEYGWKFNGHYSRFIRNGKNWKFNDNSDKIET